MQGIIIADTSCFIILHKIGHLELLQTVFGQIYTTTTIATEFGHTLPVWIAIENPKNLDLQKILNTSVDKGEASAIALALEKRNSLIILDDQKARKLAGQLQLNITGTLGVILEAKRSGKISSVKSLIDKIKLTNFHISLDLEEKILTKAGEY